MKLEKSFNSKLYRWFYCTNELPMSLCPYFWKLAIAWLFLIPVGLISLPTIIVHQFQELRKGIYNGDKFGERLFVGTAIWCGLYLLFCVLTPIGLFFTTYPKESFLFISCGVGFVVYFLGLVFLIYILVDAIKSYKEDKRLRRKYDDEGNRIIVEKKPNIIVEFIKAKYNNYCPKIEWVDENK
jgi:hypothetical protein